MESGGGGVGGKKLGRVMTEVWARAGEAGGRGVGDQLAKTLLSPSLTEFLSPFTLFFPFTFQPFPPFYAGFCTSQKMQKIGYQVLKKQDKFF